MRICEDVLRCMDDVRAKAQMVKPMVRGVMVAGAYTVAQFNNDWDEMMDELFAANGQYNVGKGELLLCTS